MCHNNAGSFGIFSIIRPQVNSKLYGGLYAIAETCLSGLGADSYDVRASSTHPGIARTSGIPVILTIGTGSQPKSFTGRDIHS